MGLIVQVWRPSHARPHSTRDGRCGCGQAVRSSGGAEITESWDNQGRLRGHLELMGTLTGGQKQEEGGQRVSESMATYVCGMFWGHHRLHLSRVQSLTGKVIRILAKNVNSG